MFMKCWGARFINLRIIILRGYYTDKIKNIAIPIIIVVN